MPVSSENRMCIENKMTMIMAREYNRLSSMTDEQRLIALDGKELPQVLKEFAQAELERLLEGKYYPEDYLKELRNKIPTTLTTNFKAYTKHLRKIYRRVIDPNTAEGITITGLAAALNQVPAPESEQAAAM